MIKPLRIDWIESDESLTQLGHGVEFHDDDLSRDEAVGVIDGSGGWYHPVGRAKVRILRTSPKPLDRFRHWAEITRGIREAVFALLVDHAKILTFRKSPNDSVGIHGRIYIAVNA